MNTKVLSLLKRHALPKRSHPFIKFLKALKKAKRIEIWNPDAVDEYYEKYWKKSGCDDIDALSHIEECQRCKEAYNEISKIIYNNALLEYYRDKQKQKMKYPRNR